MRAPLSSQPFLLTHPTTLFTACGMDLPMFRTLCEVFIDTTPAMLERMRAACDSGDARAFIAAAHTLRGTAVLVGADTLVIMLAGLERDAGGGVTGPAGLQAVRQLLQEVSAEVARAITDFTGASP